MKRLIVFLLSYFFVSSNAFATEERIPVMEIRSDTDISADFAYDNNEVIPELMYRGEFAELFAKVNKDSPQGTYYVPFLETRLFFVKSGTDYVPVTMMNVGAGKSLWSIYERNLLFERAFLFDEFRKQFSVLRGMENTEEAFLALPPGAWVVPLPKIAFWTPNGIKQMSELNLVSYQTMEAGDLLFKAETEIPVEAPAVKKIPAPSVPASTQEQDTGGTMKTPETEWKKFAALALVSIVLFLLSFFGGYFGGRKGSAGKTGKAEFADRKGFSEGLPSQWQHKEQELPVAKIREYEEALVENQKTIKIQQASITDLKTKIADKEYLVAEGHKQAEQQTTIIDGLKRKLADCEYGIELYERVVHVHSLPKDFVGEDGRPAITALPLVWGSEHKVMMPHTKDPVDIKNIQRAINDHPECWNALGIKKLPFAEVAARRAQLVS